MDEDFLYLQIASAIRRDIANGLYKMGDQLPSVRSYSESWHCTIGTVQRAIQKLVTEGLVSCHIGKGTKVIGSVTQQQDDTLKRAHLIHKAETFLLDSITSGYTTADIEDSIRIAITRWRNVSQSQEILNNKTLRFAGSHDLLIAWIATHFFEITNGYQLHLNFSGSIAGLMALADGKADLAGSHLWDEKTHQFNTPFLQSLFPGENLALITLAYRKIGLIVSAGNPKNITRIEDLARNDVTFVNRHAGSGTRVYLDSLLKNASVDSNRINGYQNQKTTHSEIAAEIAEGRADVGLGLEAAAKAYDLDFVFLNLERYDLVLKKELLETGPILNLINWLKSSAFFDLLEGFGGYEFKDAGHINWSS